MHHMDPTTGEIHTRGPRPPLPLRFLLYALQQIVADLMPDSRTAKCMRWTRKDEQPQILMTAEGKAHYGGLQTCGAVWNDPFCAYKISARRTAEVQKAETAWKLEGGSLYLLTLTAQHSRETRIEDTADMLAAARRYFFSTRAVKNTLKQMGYIGQIILLEPTVGENGWHPHNHALLFHKHKRAPLPEWLETLRDQWEIASLRAGLQKPSREHGLRLDDGTKAAAYVSKWGLAEELTKTHAKTRGGKTPFQLLQDILDDPNNRQAKRLFLEYTAAMKGRRALTWSRGLKARFKIDHKTDEEIAGEQENHSQTLATLTTWHWRIIQQREDRALLLHIAETEGREGIDRYLEALPKEPRNTNAIREFDTMPFGNSSTA